MSKVKVKEVKEELIVALPFAQFFHGLHIALVLCGIHVLVTYSTFDLATTVLFWLFLGSAHNCVALCAFHQDGTNLRWDRLFVSVETRLTFEHAMTLLARNP